MATIFAAAMPRYLAVSRMTEIDTPSRSRAASRIRSTVIAVRSPLTMVLHVRFVARLDAPDQPPHDAGGRDLGVEAAGPLVVFALDRVEREPRHGRRTAAGARHRLPAANDAGRRVLGHRKVDEIAGAARRADPRFGDRARCPRADDGALPKQLGKASRDRFNRRGRRRRFGIQCRDAERHWRARTRGGTLDGLDDLYGGGREIGAGGIGPGAHHALVVDHQCQGRRVTNLETGGGWHRRYGSPVQSLCK